MSISVLLWYLLVGIYYLLLGYFYLIIASILLSWLPEIKNTRVGQIITRLTDPFLNVFRGLIVVGMFDFTPIIGILLYQFGLRFFIEMVNMIGQNL